MATDILLDDFNGEWLTLAASAIKGVATDFMLDYPQRRGSSDGHRRALVHDAHDGLTINFNDDYPGGVTLNSVVSISPKARSRPINPVLSRVTERTTPELLVHGGLRFVWDHGQRVSGPATEEVSLQSVIEDLRNQVAALSERVAALERR